MRTIKELLELMLKHKDLFYSGLCAWCTALCSKDLMSEEEWDILHSYIQKNRPNMFSSRAAFKSRKEDYFWPKYYIEHRVKWINKHIEKLSIAEIVKLP